MSIEAFSGNHFNSMIVHEPVTAEYGKKAGGAALVAFEHAQYATGGRVISPANGHKPSIPHEVFNQPSSENNDELYEILTQDEWLNYFEQTLKNGRATLAHYYVAGGIVTELNSHHVAPKLYMGHSWDRVVSTMDHGRKASPTREMLESRIIRDVDGIVIATQAEAELLAEKYADVIPGGKAAILNKTHRIPLGVEHQTFSPEHMSTLRREARTSLLPDELGCENNTVIYTLGRMSPQKGHLDAVNGFAEALQQDPSLAEKMSLSVIGGPLSGEYYQRIVDTISQLPNFIRRRITFHDAQPAVKAHAMGDIFAGPSSWETWFLSLSEAMACGKPTVVTDMPILREVGGEGTIFVEQGDTDTLGRTFTELVTNPQLQRDLGVANYRKAQEYSWQKAGLRLDSIVDNLNSQR